MDWPAANGASISLDPGSYDATANDDPANWCLATSTYDAVSPNYGTPDGDNDSCD
mgnify:CR=1 FL=1